MNINEDNHLTGAVIGAAIEVHRQLGPLLDEAAYEEALAQKLIAQEVACRRQVPLPLTYKSGNNACVPLLPRTPVAGLPAVAQAGQ